MAMPEKYEILMYWQKIKAKEFFPKAPDGVPLLEYMGVIDPMEPCCWACGKMIYIGETEENLEGRWNSAELERHHILMRSFGGEDHARNLFLLCNDCHRETPSIQISIIDFLRWAKFKKDVENRSSKDFQRILNESLNAFFENEFEAEVFLDWFEGICKDKEKFNAYAEKFVTKRHFDKSEGSVISYAGYIIRFIQYFKHECTEILKEVSENSKNEEKLAKEFRLF